MTPLILRNCNIFFFREHLRDCSFAMNLSMASYALPFKRKDMRPIIELTYVSEEVYVEVAPF